MVMFMVIFGDVYDDDDDDDDDDDADNDDEVLAMIYES